MASLHHPSLCAHTQATSCESHKARVLAGHGQGPHHPGPPWEGPPKGAHTFSKHQERARTEQNRKLHVPPLGAQESQGGGGWGADSGGQGQLRPAPSPTSLPEAFSNTAQLETSCAQASAPQHRETPQSRGRAPHSHGAAAQLPPWTWKGLAGDLKRPSPPQNTPHPTDQPVLPSTAVLPVQSPPLGTPCCPTMSETWPGISPGVGPAFRCPL